MFQTVFMKSSASNTTCKLIECVRVDGAGDEGPSHQEVQYWWCLRHFQKKWLTTLVSTRCSGCSYLNKVELQNGCLSKGHANLFIPSTLAGNPIVNGKIDNDKLAENLRLAMDVYIKRVDQTPFGDTVINLFPGAEAQDLQEERELLLVFLKGSEKNRTELKCKNPASFSKFEMIWKIRNNHMRSDLPSQYLFFLVCRLEHIMLI